MVFFRSWAVIPSSAPFSMAPSRTWALRMSAWLNRVPLGLRPWEARL